MTRTEGEEEVRKILRKFREFSEKHYWSDEQVEVGTMTGVCGKELFYNIADAEEDTSLGDFERKSRSSTTIDTNFIVFIIRFEILFLM